MSTSLAWDERYTGGEFQFGTAPNEYLRAQAWRFRPGMATLAVGDGEGRNGVWLAKLGLAVTSLDWSAVAVEKAQDFAAKRGVELDARQADVARWDWPEAQYDLIAWIYLHLPPEDRAIATAGCLRALKPGGLLVLECFSPAQEGRRSGGPKILSLLWDRAIVEREFAGLEVLELTEGAVRLDEGPRHQGLAEVVRCVLRKP
ncbi:SAM-dependent methyltransferase [Sediminicoccus rosea]|jgi:SAM-dependent methyltransferase|uniref:Class I SAM-dependent methyltransferase n=1 Tax=Sediminicoccus rosea TaxID=1225128 RepID=A0ABZ0PMH9_9PROT|nr:class I SAM-dependent methyltransferase [Sediminicoccus rosea]WPB86305.1 class I SAM-dependent methyltransferase [Sediminicoccus rosea]